MDSADLQKLFDGYNREIQVLDRTRYKHPEVSGKEIAYLYKLSVAMQNTLRGLSAYEDAVEQLPVLEHIQMQCVPKHYGSILNRQSSAFTRISILEDLAYQVQQAGDAQLQRLNAKGLSPNLQLELGIAELKQRSPSSFEAHFNTAETLQLLRESLQHIQTALGRPHAHPPTPPNWAARSNNGASHEQLIPLMDLLLHTREALTQNLKLDYKAQEAFPLLLDSADMILDALRTEKTPSDTTLDSLFGLLKQLANELPPSHVNDALKRKAQTIATARNTAEITK